jgi:hypothetical protein
MPFSGILRPVALIRTDVSGERIASIRCLLRLLVTANAVASSPILLTLMIEVIRSSETSVLTRVKRRNILDGGILNEKSNAEHFHVSFEGFTVTISARIRAILRGFHSFPHFH